MVRILLVDDEPVVLRAFSTLVDWEAHGYIIAGCAENGKKALQFLKESTVDIVMTDLSMPVMDGFELIHEIKTQYPAIRIVVLSVFDNYASVKQAFLMGADDYVLKTDSNFTALITILNRLKADRYSTILDIMKKLIFNNEEFSSDELDTIKSTFHMDGNTRFCVGTISIFPDDKLQTDSILPPIIARDLTDLCKQNPSCFGINLFPNRFFTLYFSQNEYVEQEAMALLEEQIALASKHGYCAFAGLSREYTYIEETFNAYHEAMKSTELAASRRSESVIVFDTHLVEPTLSRHIIDREFITKITDSILKFDYDEANNYIREMFQQRHEDFTSSSYLYKSALFKLLYRVESALSDSANLHNLMDMDKMFYQRAVLDVSTQELIFRRTVHQLINHLKKDKLLVIPDAIIQAKDYISKNYKSKITLDDIAQHVCLNSSYLSSLFSKHVGTSCVDYLNSIRIQKAEVMLQNTNLFVYEIAYNVGFKTVEHFSRVFKKQTGRTPDSYRQRSIDPSSS